MAATIDRLDFGDEQYAGTPRTQNISANILSAELESSTATATTPLSALGDG